MQKHTAALLFLSWVPMASFYCSHSVEPPKLILPKTHRSRLYHLKAHSSVTHTRGASQHEDTCLELVKTHVPHCLWSTQVLEATKIQISPCSPALQPTSSFLFLSLPLLQRAQHLLSGCNQSLFCARCNLIGPLFSPKEKIQIFAPRAVQGPTRRPENLD